MKKERLSCIAFEFPFLSLPSTIQISKLPFNAATFLAIHSSVAISFTQYTNKQNFLPIVTSFLQAIATIILKKQITTE
jgi:hypothetical protein